MNEPILKAQFEYVSKFFEVMSGEKMWKCRSKETPIADGSLVIARTPYTKSEWMKFGGKDGRGAWVDVKHYKYFIGVFYDGEVYAKHSDDTFSPYKYAYDWFTLSLDDKIYDKAKRAYDKAKQKEEEERIAKEIAYKKAEEERIERERREKEEAEARAIAAAEAEEERLSSTMTITVRMWEEMMSRISDLEERLSCAESHIDFGDYEPF